MELVQPRLEIPLWSIQERITSNTDKYLGMDEICWGLGDQIELNGDINIVQPDIMLFCNEQKLPCAIFEILSPSTAYKDRKAKYYLYERAGVKEYYIVDPIMKIVEKFVLIDGEYRFNGAYGGEDNIKLECIEGSLNIEDIFDL